MKLLNRIKYRLLRWLLVDICKNSGADDCVLRLNIRFDGTKRHTILGEILRQAEKTWRIE